MATQPSESKSKRVGIWGASLEEMLQMGKCRTCLLRDKKWGCADSKPPMQHDLVAEMFLNHAATRGWLQGSWITHFDRPSAKVVASHVRVLV